MGHNRLIENALSVLFAGLLLVVPGCASPSTPTAQPEGLTEPDSSLADGATSEGADARLAGVRTTDVSIVDEHATDVETVDVETADVESPDVHTADVRTADAQTADAQTADVQASRDACVPDDAGIVGIGCCGSGSNDAGSVPKSDAANLVGPPGGGLVGNSNYFIAGVPPGSTIGRPISGLDVSIAVAQDVPVPHHLDFQLNAWSPQGANTAWHQYIFDYYNPSGLSGFIDNWPSQGYAQQLGLPKGGDLINFRVSPNPVVALSHGTLPAGYTLDIRLQNDTSGNITGVTFSVIDTHCKFTSTGVVKLVGLPTDLSGAPIPPMNIKVDAPSPIYALQLDVASQDNVSSGWGTITYSADNLLYVWNDWPPELEWKGIVTAESSNVHFGEIPSTPSHTITQTFMPP
jgi:hypothetical protein